MWYPFLLVFIGGGLGSVCRFGLSLLLMPFAWRFPWATLLSNALACLVLGIIVGLQLHQAIPDTRRLLVATGFCGGFSTFSTFSAETIQLYQSGQTLLAAGNLVGSMTVCTLCLLLGVRIVS
jgi:CrcB protein